MIRGINELKILIKHNLIKYDSYRWWNNDKCRR